MHIFALQYDIVWEDRPANVATIRRLLDETKSPAGSMIVLPEMALTGFSMNVERVAESSARESEAAFVKLARDYQSWVVGGLVTRMDDARGRNEAVILDPGGAIAGRYTKMHPFSYTGEQEHYASGDEPGVIECAGLKVAPFVCYDLRFPEIFRTATRRGAEVFIVIACWLEGRHNHWPVLLRARAIENQAWVVGVNRVGRDPRHNYLGGSCVIDPTGEIVAKAGDGEAVVQSSLSLERLQSARAEFPALRDLRPDWVRP